MNLTLADGRTLQWTDNGIESTSTLVFHHGTTIAMDVWDMWLKTAAEKGVRAIALNRPGVHHSTRNVGRRIIDDVADARELLQHLNIESFVAVGWSGGGARALGSGLIENCRAIHTIAGISPMNPDDPSTYAGMSEERIEQTRKFLADYSEIVRVRGESFEDDVKMTEEMALEFLSQLPNFASFENDYRDFARDFTACVLNALMQGVEPDADDYLGNISPWGFELTEITKPVTVWHGDVDDDVIVSRGEYNHEHLPHSRFHRLEGQGHISIMVEARAEILNAAIESLGV